MVRIAEHDSYLAVVFAGGVYLLVRAQDGAYFTLEDQDPDMEVLDELGLLMPEELAAFETERRKRQEWRDECKRRQALEQYAQFYRQFEGKNPSDIKPE